MTKRFHSRRRSVGDAFRRLHHETLEKRMLLAVDIAGPPRLAEISPDGQETFANNELNELEVSASELTFRFDGGQGLDQLSLAEGIRVIASGGDDTFDDGNVQEIIPGFLGFADRPNQPTVEQEFGLFALDAGLVNPLPVTTIAEAQADETALDRYVAKPDASYAYSLADTIVSPGITTYIIDMTSQTWRSASEVDKPVWQHWVQIIVPDNAVSSTAVLVISGGSNNQSAPTQPDQLAAGFALQTNQITVSLPGVPSQPLLFTDEVSTRSEDEIIAYTFDKFLNGGDEEWPLLLPMVKSAVRAMDTAQDFLADNTTQVIEDFVVVGASKRGWTTWLTAAVDPRVSGIVPVVIDVLNLEVSMINHKKNYAGVDLGTVGGYSIAIQDYVDLNIFDRLGTPQGEELVGIVDPYSYLDRLAMPKYILNGSGDPFFTPDSSQFYINDLIGPTYLRYFPNAGHGLTDEAPGAIATYIAAVEAGVPLPEFDWTVEGADENVIRVNTVDTPLEVKLWQATNPDSLDFRIETFGPRYTSTTLTDQGGGEYIGSVPLPATGGTAFFVELTYAAFGQSLTFTTEARIAKPPSPELIAIRPDAGALLLDGDRLNVAPREFNLLFKGGANLDETTIDTSTIKLVRSGGDGSFGENNDVEVALGYVGLVNPGSTDPADLQRIVFRAASSAAFNANDPANAFPDDTYQIQIIGSGANPLTNLAGASFNGGNDSITTFRLDRGAQVVSVVPQPIGRGPLSQDPLAQASDEIIVYFDDQPLDPVQAVDPKFYRLVNTATTLTTDDDRTLLPQSVIYDSVGNSVVLKFASDIPEGTYRLDVGRSSDDDSTAIEVGTLSDGDLFVENGFLGDVNGTSEDDTDVDLYNLQLKSGAALVVSAAPHSPLLNLRVRLLDGNGSELESVTGVGLVDLSFDVITAGTYVVEVTSENGETGSYVIEASVDLSPLSANDDNSTVSSATDIGLLGATTITISSQIQRQSIPLPPRAGGEDEPGHRQIQRERHIGGAGTTPVAPQAIRTRQYSFPDIIGRDPSGNPYLNLITEAEKQIVREIYEIYAQQSGFEFIESTGGGGTSIGKGDLRALDPSLGPNSGVAGLGGASAVVINGAIYDQANRTFGDGFTAVMFHELGHSLGLGHAYDQPAIMGGGLPNDIAPGDNDIAHLQRIVPSNSTDIDMYRFDLVEPGRLQVETFAERLTTPSLLNTTLQLYRQVGTDIELVAQNDQYFGADSFLDLSLESGTYFIGVTSTGNTQYDPRVPDSGFGGTTDGPYDLKIAFKASNVADALQDTDGTAIDGDADGKPGGVYSFWFQASDETTTIFVDKANDSTAGAVDGVGTLADPYDNIESALRQVGTRIVVPTDGVATIVDGEKFIVDDGLNSVTFRFGTIGPNPVDISAATDAGDIALAIETAINNSSLASTVVVSVTGRVVQFSSIDNLDLDSAPTLLETPNLIRIVGNGGDDGDLSTLSDNRPYLIGVDTDGNALEDGAEFLVPQGVTVMIDGGALLKLRKANLDAGTSAVDLSRSRSAIQLLGTPESSVFLRSYFDDSVGGNSSGAGPNVSSGDFGGIVFRADSDLEASGIFLNYVNNADIKNGGGKVSAGPQESVYSPIHIIDARPTISFSYIWASDDAAISASPDSFEETVGRIGPDVVGNFLVDNTIDGMFIRVQTPLGSTINKLTVSGRLDDTDIPHVLTENLIIAGAAGGPILEGGTLVARAAGRLMIDPGTVLKISGARIEAERGAGSIIAEGTVDRPIIFTSLNDNRYGGSGSFDTNSSPNSVPLPGDWGGLYFGEATFGSLDNAIIAFGGGTTPIEGGAANFNVIEVHQADLRVSSTLLQYNAGGNDPQDGLRNGRGANFPATIYVRGSQPIIVDNVITDNAGPAININANSLQFEGLRDPGRSTGVADQYLQFADNRGPLVRLNELENNLVNGMVIRGEELTTKGIWDDTDIVHVVLNEIVVDNLHTYGGLTLQSSNSESLVVKFDNFIGTDAGLTASGTPQEIIDRIGGTIAVLGTVGNPVVLTSLFDDSVGAGYTPTGEVMFNTNNSSAPSTGVSGRWRGLLFDEFSNDRNVAIIRELENPLTSGVDINATPFVSQALGTLAPNEKGGDENRRLGFEVTGFISPDDPTDLDVYSFTATAGTGIWIDVDRTDTSLDAIVEVINSNGTVLARSMRSGNLTDPDDINAQALNQNSVLGGDYFTQNFRDPGLYYVLPGAVGQEGDYFVRIRSNPASAGDVSVFAGESRGEYSMQIRLRQIQEFPGSTVRFADIRFAQVGIDVRGLPAHSPLIGEAGELDANNDTVASAQVLVNLFETDIAALGIAGELSDANDVDWYQFGLEQTGVQVIEGVNDSSGTVAVVFDIDYSDNAVRGDTTIAVFDEQQQLIYIGRESNIQDDQPIDSTGNIDDLSRGSLGKKDPFIGPIHLTPGGNYYVAVMSNRQLPSALTGVFEAVPVNPLNTFVRLEPVSSLVRVVEDRIGSQGYVSGSPILPSTPGGLFDISSGVIGSGTGVDASVTPLTLQDVVLFVATDIATDQDGDGLYTVDPFQSNPFQTRLTDSLIAGGDDIQDIVIRSDGRMFGYQQLSGGVGALVELDPSNIGTILSTQNDGIPGSVPTPNVRDLQVSSDELSGFPSPIAFANALAEEFTNRGEVGSLTFRRTGTDGPSDAPVPTYEVYYAVNERSDRNFDPSSKLYRAKENGDASRQPAENGNPKYGRIGDIQPVGVRYASRLLTISDGAALPNITRIRIESKIPGSTGNEITINISRPDDTEAVVLSVAGTTINLGIGGIGGPPLTGAPTAAAIVDAINSDSDASALVTAVIVSGNASELGDGDNGTVALNLGGGNSLNLTGGSDDANVQPLQGRVTGLAMGDFFGQTELYGVTDAGEFLLIDQESGDVIRRLDVNAALGANVSFTGLALGPQNVENGNYKNTLFATTIDGSIYAFDTEKVYNIPIAAVFDDNAPAKLFDLLPSAGDPNLTISQIFVEDDVNGGVSVSGSRVTVDPGAYDSLELGQQATILLRYTLSDGNGKSVQQLARVTIVGADDVNVATAPGVSAAIQKNFEIYQSPSDVDLLEFAGDPNSGDTFRVEAISFVGNAVGLTFNSALNTLTVDPNAYDFLAVGSRETIVSTYNVVYSNGASFSQTATIVVERTTEDAITAIRPIFDADGDGVAESYSANVSGIAGSPIGLAFSPLDFNLWHPTNKRGSDSVDDLGHGIFPAPDGTRKPVAGETSLYFGFEEWVDAPASTPADSPDDAYLQYNGVNAQYGILTAAFQSDLSSNPNIANTYNFPGGSYGSLTTNAFSLAGSVKEDRPTLYFNYFLESENYAGSNNASDVDDPFRDSARVFVSRNGGVSWELVATNNSLLSVADPTDVDGTAELPGFLSARSDAGLNSGAPRAQSQQIVQELFDNTGVWRQARVDLSTFFNEPNLMLRVDFSTAGAMGDATLGQIDANFGEFTSAERSIRSLNNAFEGFYIDDFIVGYAERGEMVTGTLPDASIIDLFADGARTANTDPEANPDILQGPYQLEVRRTDEYISQGDEFNSVSSIFDTNARFTQEDNTTGLLGDRNRERAQGVFIVDSNFISDSLLVGINVEPGVAEGTGSVPHPGSNINFPQLNQERLVPGIVIQNNVISGSSGIRFAGETSFDAQRPVSFGRIINNTLVGENRTGVGIAVEGLASPTLLNNLIADFSIGILDMGIGTVVRSNFFQNNAGNGSTGTASIVSPSGSPLFLDSANRNFILQAGSLAVDSSQNTEQDRFNYLNFKTEIGIPASPINAPERDIYGQLRVDSNGAPGGGGSEIFKDRGATDRSDTDNPYAVLLNPIDNDSLGQDRDPTETVVYMSDRLLENFRLLLGDGPGPNSPFEGTGVNGLTVDDPNDSSISSQAIAISQNGELLIEGVDYTIGYNELTGVLLLTPVSTLWERTSVYTIRLDNSLIADKAGNLLRANQADGSTQFTIVMPDVQFDFGDAPASYGTLRADRGALHTFVTSSLPRLGVNIDSEADGQPIDNDDAAGIDDEDGLQIGTMIDGSSSYVVFTTPGANANDVQPDEVLGFLNPDDPSGADVSIQVTGTGFLDGWIDFNQNGVFDESERVLDSLRVSGDPDVGSFVTVNVQTPTDAIAGMTWMRIRISPSGGLSPTEMAFGGEVEDYPVEVYRFTAANPNEAPVFEITAPLEAGVPTIDLLEQDDFAAVVIDDFAVNIFPGSPTSFDETVTQNVTFSVTEVGGPSGLIASVSLGIDGTLTIFPVPDAVGTVVYSVTLTDDHPTDPKSTTKTLVVNLRPVNDPPALNPLAVPSSGSNPSDNEDSYSVASDGTITYTLREDNTQPGGVTEPFFIPLVADTGGVASGVTFSNASSELDFEHRSVEFQGDGLAGAAWFDYDNDDFLDLFLTNGRTQDNALFRNLGDGTFEDVTATAGVADGMGSSGVVAGDIDNDGFVDLLLTGDGGIMRDVSSSGFKLYRNNGDGTFTDITASSGVVEPATSLSAALADIDNDGFLDLFITAPGSLATRTQQDSKLFRNNGDLTFTDITAASGVDAGLGACAAGFSDYDGDGDVDLFVANCNDVTFAPTPIQLFRNDGNLNFTDVTTESGLGSYLGFWMATSFADYDNDGDIDLFATNSGASPGGVLSGSPHGLFQNQGDGTFVDVASSAGVAEWEFGWGAAFNDLDNDGYADLFFTGSLPPLGIVGPGQGNPGRLFFNALGKVGSDGFNEASTNLGIDLSNEYTSGVANGDYNNDGFVDLVIMTDTLPGAAPESPELLLNDGNSNRWLGVQLVGTVSNRDGVGARVTVETASLTQVKEVYAGSSVLSMDSQSLRFGLGAEDSVTRIQVNWPSGLVESFSAAAGVDRIVELVEGTGGPPTAGLTFNAVTASNGVFNRIGLLDVLTVGPPNEADGTPGGSQTLSLISPSGSPNQIVDFTVQQLTDNDIIDANPQVSGSNVVWESGLNSPPFFREIMFFDGTTTTQVTDNAFTDRDPQVSGNNVTWWGQPGSSANDREIFFWDGTTITQVTNDLTRDENSQISGSTVVWEQRASSGFEIYKWDGGSPQNVSNNTFTDLSPQIDGSNIVYQTGGFGVFAISRDDGTNNTFLSSGGANKKNPQLDDDRVVWEQFDPTERDWDIYYFDGTNTVPLTDNDFNDFQPQVSGENVVWRGGTFPNIEIYLYDGLTTRQITNNSVTDTNPQIDGNIVVWQASDGNDNEIFAWDGTRITQLTDNDYNDELPQISGNQVVWQAWSKGSGNGIEIFRAELTLGSFETEQGGRLEPVFDGSNLIGLNYFPPADFNFDIGVDSFTYEVTDNGTTWDLDTGSLFDDPQSRTNRVEFVLAPVNDAPVFDLSTDPVVVEEDGGQVSLANFATNIGGGPIDTAVDENDPASLQSLTFSITPLDFDVAEMPEFFSSDPVLDAQTGRLTFQTAGDVFGSYQFEVRLTDGDADDPTRGDVNQSAPQLLTINVLPQNDPPLVKPTSPAIDYTLDEDTTIEIEIDDLLDLFDPGPRSMFGDESADLTPGGNQTVSIADPIPTTTSAGGTLQMVTTGGPPRLLYTPPLNFNGIDTFVYSVTDDGVTVGLDEIPFADPRTATNTVTLNINSVNDPPLFDIDAPLVGGIPTLNFLESDDSTAISVANFALNIAPGPITAVDELASQTVFFTILESNVPGGLMSQLPQLTPDGRLTFYPIADAVGSATYTATLTDDHPTDPQSTTKTFTINLQPVNDPPALNPLVVPSTDANPTNGEDSYTVASDGTITYTLREDNTQSVGVTEPFFIPLSAATSGSYNRIGLMDVFTVGPVNESDGTAGGSQSLSLISPTVATTTERGGTLTPVAGGWNYVPPADYNFAIGGFDSFIYEVGDDGTSYDLDTDTLVADPLRRTNRVEFGLAPVNDAPVFDLSTDRIVVTEDSLQVSIANFVTNIGRGPIGTAIDENDLASLQTLEFSITPLDFDGADMSVFFSSEPVLSTQTGRLSFQTAVDVFGSYQFEVRLNDGGANDPVRGDVNQSAPQLLTINVLAQNDPPLIMPTSPAIEYTLNEDNTIEIEIGDLVDAFDPGPLSMFGDESANVTPGGNQTVFIADPIPTTTSAGGTLQLVTTGGPPRLLYTPRQNFNGIDSFVYRVTDDGVTVGLDEIPFSDPRTATNTVTLNVSPVNDAPSFELTALLQSDEDAGLVTVESWATNVQAGPATATDEISGPTPQNLSFVFTQTGGDPNLIVPGSIGAVIDPLTGIASLSYQSALDANGTAIFQVVLQDDGPADAGNGDQNVSPSSALTIEVAAINDPPSFSFVTTDPILLPEDSGPQSIPLVENISPGPSDEDFQTVLFEIQPLAPEFAALFSDLPTIDTNGVLRFTTAPNQNTDNVDGPVPMRFVARDSEGAESADFAFQIEITEVNDAPIANGDSFDSDEDSVLTINVSELLENDIDPDLQTNANEVLQIQLALPPQTPSGASLLYDQQTGEITYNPTGIVSIQEMVSGEFLAESFTYSLIDTAGEVSNVVTVSLNIAGVNDAPTTVSDTPLLQPNGSTVVWVLDNDSDIDGTIDPSSVQVSADPIFGIFVVTPAGAIIYTPFTTFPGEDSFSYTVADNLGLRSEPSTVTVSTNPSLFALDDTGGTFVGEPIRIDVAANDLQPDRLNLSSIAIVSQPLSGQAIAQSDGTVLYLPDADFIGSDSFSYQISDDLGRASNIANVETLVVASQLQNPNQFADVNGDGNVTALDALLVINLLSRNGNASEIPVVETDRGPNFYDVNGNQSISAVDALQVVNSLRLQNVEPEAEQGQPQAIIPTTAAEKSSKLIDPVITDFSDPAKIVNTPVPTTVSQDVIDLIVEQRDPEEEDMTTALIDAAMADLL